MKNAQKKTTTPAKAKKHSRKLIKETLEALVEKTAAKLDAKTAKAKTTIINGIGAVDTASLKTKKTDGIVARREGRAKAAAKKAETKAAKPAAKKTAKPATAKTTKGGTILAMIARKGGATAAELLKATGWQAHSLRGFLSVANTKGLAKITSEQNDAGERVYASK
jgi:hypothetical protein